MTTESQAPSVLPPECRVAVVHDFFGVFGGAERVALEIAQLFPAAPIFTSVFTPSALPPDFPTERLRAAPFNYLPGSGPHYRAFLPILPFYFSSLDLTDFDIVISSSIAFAKAARTRPDAIHICYCHTTNRYAWELDEYLTKSGMAWPTRIAARIMSRPLRSWDKQVGSRPNVMVANSHEVQRRIERVYGRTSEVIYPFVYTGRFKLRAPETPYLLVVSRLVGYKRIDLAIRVANQLGLELKIVGAGPAERELRAIAGSTVEFLGVLPDLEVSDLYSRCSAFLFPGLEDFGITPLEAMASGRPVVAYAGGGVLETVVDGVTGVMFQQQSVDAVANAVTKALNVHWDSSLIRRRAADFDVSHFRESILKLAARYVTR